MSQFRNWVYTLVACLIYTLSKMSPKNNVFLPVVLPMFAWLGAVALLSFKAAWWRYDIIGDCMSAADDYAPHLG